MVSDTEVSDTVKVMGVVNVTPDSFDESVRTPSADAAVERCVQLIEEGAHILDIGGESTRPGADDIAADEQLARVLPVIEAVAPNLRPDVAISVDTRDEAVARAAVAAGASIINDMSASLGPVAGELGVGYVAAHMPGTPKTMQDDPQYDDVVGDVLGVVLEAARQAAAAGASRVWIDPGLGFGKTIDHNLDLIAHIDRFVGHGFGVLAGISRKATIGRLHAASDAAKPLGSEPPILPTPTDDRLEGSIAVAAWCALLGVEVVRVHDVSDTIQAMQVVAARNWA